MPLNLLLLYIYLILGNKEEDIILKFIVVLRRKEKSKRSRNSCSRLSGARHYLAHSCCKCSLESGELGRSGSTNTDLTVLNGLIGQGEFGEVVTDHVCLNFDTVPVLATVDIDN